MIAFLLLLVGWATYYDPGVMEQVAAYRGLECRECIGLVALNDCGDLGRQVWLYRPDLGEWSGPYLNVDCAQQAHKTPREAQGYVVEVDWPTAHNWGMQGPVPIRVAERPPRWWLKGETR